jgi:hypothetical protein
MNKFSMNDWIRRAVGKGIESKADVPAPGQQPGNTPPPPGNAGAGLEGLPAPALDMNKIIRWFWWRKS